MSDAAVCCNFFHSREQGELGGNRGSRVDATFFFFTANGAETWAFYTGMNEMRKFPCWFCVSVILSETLIERNQLQEIEWKLNEN